jgi:hypothetical protein
MFNLDEAILEWRRRMLATGIKTPVPLDELESHLREDFDAQIRAGAAPERAFETAAQKIGPAVALQSEFKKVDAAGKEGDRALEQKLLIISVIISNILIPLLMSSMVLFKWGSLSDMTSLERTSSLTAVATFALLVWSGRLGYRLFPVVRAERTKAVIAGLVGVPVVLWLIVFFNLILPRHDFITMGSLIVALYWGLAPVGVVIGLHYFWYSSLILGIETSTRKKVGLASA